MKMYETRITCTNCGHEWSHGHRQSITVEVVKLTDAWIEYRQCPECQHIALESIHIGFDAGSTPEAGIFNQIAIPATREAWETDKAEDIFRRLFMNQQV